MFCSNCGSQNDDKSKFCTNCSKPLQAVTAAPPVAKKKTLRTVIIAVVCLIVAFVLWVEFSPNEAAGNSDLTTAAATTTATTAAIAAPETTAVPAEPTQPAETVAPTQAPIATTKAAATLTAANTAEEALTLVRQLTGLTTNAEFYREEDFIYNDDGTLSIDVNTPELATATCFIISENGYTGDGYDNCFIVLKGTDQIYTAQAGGNGIMERIH